MARTPRASSTQPPLRVVPAAQGKAAAPERPKLRRGLGNRTAKNLADQQADIARAQRRARVVELKVRGLTNYAIARELLIDEKTVREDLRAACSAPPPMLEELREVSLRRLETEHERIDVQQTLLRRQLVNEDGSPKRLDVHALSVITRTMSRNSATLVAINGSLRKLFGVDAPERKEVSGPGGGPVPVAAASVSFTDLLTLAAENEKAPEE